MKIKFPLAFFVISLLLFVAIPAQAASKTASLYRVYNPHSGAHVYTTSLFERNAVVKAGWQGQGIAWQAPKNGGIPVYRVYNPNSGEHFYTKSLYESQQLVKKGWRAEGIAFQVARQGLPVYRLYNPRVKAGPHFYTESSAERKIFEKAGWKYENVAWSAVNGATLNLKLNYPILIGQKWQPQDAFVSATDPAGNSLKYQQIRVTGAVNTGKLGSYQVTYINGAIQKTVTVVVHDKSALAVKDSTISVNAVWKPEDNLVFAKDGQGNSATIGQVQVSGNVDTSVTGNYPVTYSISNQVRQAIVTVANPTFGLSAHRGAHLLAPENSLQAIAQAASLGYKAVEVDLQATSDGTVVLMHDGTIDRTTTGTGAVSQMTFDQLESYDLRTEAYPNYQGQSLKVPSFASAAQLLAGTSLYLNIDGQHGNWSDSNFVNNIVTTLKNNQIYGRTFFMLTDPSVRNAFLAAYPDATVSWLYDGSTSIDDEISLCKNYPNVIFALAQAYAKTDTIKALVKAGVRVYVYNVLSVAAANYFKSLGVWACETDNLLPSNLN